jgi:hypothetical protein
VKISRAFSKQAGPDGRLVFRRKQTLIVPVTVIRATLNLDAPMSAGAVRFSCFLDGSLIAAVEGRSGEPLVYEPNLRLARGEREIRIVAEGIAPNAFITGIIEADLSLF